MINRTLLLLFLVFTSFLANAQKTIKDDVIQSNLLTPYSNYFAAGREMIYTQFNKSSYMTGEDVWFTCWVLNPLDKRLSFNTTKLYVELWSVEKKMLSRKILFVKGGTASNYLHLDDSLVAGTYCFRAYTSWMRNFYEEKEFNRTITVLAPTVKSINNNNSVDKLKASVETKPKDADITSTNSRYNIRFLPEGGHFIEDLDNIFGVKVTDGYGRGVAVKGKVVDSAGIEIVTFSTGPIGMNRFVIANAAKANYRAIVELPDGGSKEVKLPDPEKQGVSISINPYLHGAIRVRLQVNPLTRSLKQNYFLMVHADGVNYKDYHIGFEEDSSVQIQINKEDLGNGIIYATLFNEDLQPFAERIFYNRKSPLTGRISLKATAEAGDTVRLTIQSSDSLKMDQVAKLSMSVLPEGTVMNDFSGSLLVESQLRPILKGDIENPGYYFEKNDTEHLLALDNLLLIQGWRKYDWQDLAKKNTKQFQYPFEQDFSIDGTVKNWVKNRPDQKSQISLISPQNKLMLVSPVDSASEFHFRNLYLKDSSYVIAAASSMNGANWNRTMQMKIQETTLDVPVFDSIVAPPAKKEVTEAFIPSMTKGVIRLGEVLVTAQRKNPFNNDMFVGVMGKQFEVTKENYKVYADVEHILIAYFNVQMRIDPDSGRWVFDMGRGNIRFDLGSVPGGPSSTPPLPPVILLDGMKVSDPIEILSIPMNMIESIAVDKSGTNFSRNGIDNGLIAITTRLIPLAEKYSGEAANIKRVIVNGYAQPKEYFEPKYLLQPAEADYSKYATVYWKPEIVTDSTGTTSFKFYVPNPIKSIVIRMEGISYDGLFFLHQEKCILPKRDE